MYVKTSHNTNHVNIILKRWSRVSKSPPDSSMCSIGILKKPVLFYLCGEHLYKIVLNDDNI